MSKSSLKNLKYAPSLGYQLTKTLSLFLYQKLKKKKALSDILRTYAEEKIKFNLDLKVYKENYFDINFPFHKRTDALINGFQYCDTTTQKQETIELYDYKYHLKNFGFMWEHALLELKYEITLYADEQTLTKKITMGTNIRFKITVDKFSMMYATNRDNVASIFSEWVKETPIYFNIIEPAQVKHFNTKAINNLFYSTTMQTARTVIMAHRNLIVSYLGQVLTHKIVISKYYHENTDKKFLRFFRFVKSVTS